MHPNESINLQCGFPQLNSDQAVANAVYLYYFPHCFCRGKIRFFALAFPMTFLLAPKTFCGPRLFNKLPLAAPTIPQWRWKSHNSGVEKRGKRQAARRAEELGVGWRKAGKLDESDAEFCFWLFRLSVCSPALHFSAFPGQPLVAVLCVTFARFFGFSFRFTPLSTKSIPSVLFSFSVCTVCVWASGRVLQSAPPRSAPFRTTHGSTDKSNKQIDLFPVAMLSVGSAAPGRKQNGVSLVNVV